MFNMDCSLKTRLKRFIEQPNRFRTMTQVIEEALEKFLDENER